MFIAHVVLMAPVLTVYHTDQITSTLIRLGSHFLPAIGFLT